MSALEKAIIHSKNIGIDECEIVVGKKNITTVRTVHSLPTLLKNIVDIGNDQRRVMQWASLPSITPSIKVEGIAVNSI